MGNGAWERSYQCSIFLYERLRPKRSYAAGFTAYLGFGSIERLVEVSRDARHTSRSVQVPCAQSGGASIPLQTPGDGVYRRFQ
jgi:hypothetical protein